jgi:hypothetical protein
MTAEHGPERTSRPSLLPETSEEEYRPVPPEPRRPAVNVPRELPPASVQEADGWIENYLRHEARWLGIRVEELERQLRRRTMILGSGLVLMAGAAAGATVAILFLLPPPHQRPQLAAPSPAERPGLAAPTAVGVTLPVPLVVAAQPTKQADNPGPPMVQPPSPEQALDPARRGELAPVTSAPERGLIEPVARRAELRDAQPIPTAETRVLPPSPPLRADDPTDPAGTTSTLRAVLSNIKSQMGAPRGAGYPRATGSMPPGFERAEAPPGALPAGSRPARPLPVPAAPGFPPEPFDSTMRSNVMER